MSRRRGGALVLLCAVGPPAGMAAAKLCEKRFGVERHPEGSSHSSNNASVEGRVSKLKLLKSEGYGGQNFDLLRARVMATGERLEGSQVWARSTENLTEPASVVRPLQGG